MPHLGWLFAVLPLVCKCPTCDNTIVCLLTVGALATVIVPTLAVARELWLLCNFREM